MECDAEQAALVIAGVQIDELLANVEERTFLAAAQVDLPEDPGLIGHEQHVFSNAGGEVPVDGGGETLGDRFQADPQIAALDGLRNGIVQRLSLPVLSAGRHSGKTDRAGQKKACPRPRHRAQHVGSSSIYGHPSKLKIVRVRPGAAVLIEPVEGRHVFLGDLEIEDLRVRGDSCAVC